MWFLYNINYKYRYRENTKIKYPKESSSNEKTWYEIRLENETNWSRDSDFDQIKRSPNPDAFGECGIIFIHNSLFSSKKKD